jgi:hypothetical protein
MSNSNKEAVEILAYIKALAKLKRAQAIEASLCNDEGEAVRLKAQSETLWVVHRNGLIGGLPELTEKIEKQLNELESS